MWDGMTAVQTQAKCKTMCHEEHICINVCKYLLISDFYDYTIILIGLKHVKGLCNRNQMCIYFSLETEPVEEIIVGMYCKVDRF